MRRTLIVLAILLPATAGAQVEADRDVATDVDAGAPCRAAHAVAATAACPRFARVTADGIALYAPVYFEIDKAVLRPVSFPVFDDVAALLARHVDLVIEVQGHYRSSGWAIPLSQRRAEVVRDYLIARGVAGDRLIAHGYGEDVPRVLPVTDARNRRIELRRLPP